VISIARRNLFHNKLRLATAVVGIAFSVLLVTCFVGLYLACARHTSGLIDNAGADLWLMARGTQSVDLGESISIRHLYRAMAAPGTEWAEPLLVQVSRWRMPDGGREVATIVGLVPDTRLNLPWGTSAGIPAALRQPDGVIIDERERHRFGSASRKLVVGDEAEILDSRASVAGFSKGVGSFTTIPYVFTSHGRAERFTMGSTGRTTFVVVKCLPNHRVEAVREWLEGRLPNFDVLTAQSFADMTRRYWLYGTGIGACIIFTAVLGLIVGFIMVSQTIYSSTMSKLAEYGTLKAMGMSNFALSRIVLTQALLLGLLSYGVGMGLAVPLAHCTASSNLNIDTPIGLIALMLLVTLATCTAASVTSVLRVFRLPPASVFRS
jgi:putative ABC transport system permease protein